jgi:hypothetical protein
MFESSVAADAVMTREGIIWFMEPEVDMGILVRCGEFVGECWSGPLN